ncbi:other/CAMKK/ELM protein kinase [Ephemerocybe angulata]|uniref:Other/CAMKK/ELM protein kinase n=1 Tax=Ephemerocybe angulata TaxID=980116 RepID=A0A8H6MCN1_9AGAR|nr:other/CAMKK/ELM protein kinase [Tulosesus angulatus]
MMRKRSASTATYLGRTLEYDPNPYDIPVTCYLERTKLNQYLREERVGKGRHGEVYLSHDTLHEHRAVAIKVVKRSNPKDKIKLLRRNYQQTDGSTKQALNSTENSVRREVAVMKQCRHPNLAQLFEVIDDPREDKIYIIMEYIPGGPVEWTHGEDHLPLLTLAQTRRIMRDVIVGLEYMHAKGIVHRDIKPSNLVYTANRSCVKLIDFGISHIMLPPAPKKEKDDPVDPELRALFPVTDLTRRIGTPSFLAPEVVWFHDDSDNTSTVRPPITPAIDVWSLGFMLYHLICTQDWLPDDYMGADRLWTGGRHPQDQSSEAYAVLNLLEEMLQKAPKDRIPLSQVKRNPFILQDVLDPKEWLRYTTPLAASPENLSGFIKSAARKFVNVLSPKTKGSGS